MSMWRVVAVLLLAAAVAARARSQAPAQINTPEQTLDRASAAYANMKTARVTFTQTLTNPLTNREETSKGEMLQRLPGQYAVTFSVPAGDRIVSDGRTVWVYLPSTNPGQAFKLTVGDGAARVPDFTAWMLDAPKERFALSDGGTAVITARATHVVRLIPRDKSAPFASAKLWIDDGDGIVRQFETIDANGSARRVRIDSIQMNVPVSDHAFVFTPPPGVKVFDQNGAAN